MKIAPKKIKYHSVLWAIVFLAAALIVSATAMFAWFESYLGVSVKNSSVAVSGSNVTIGNEITLTRTLPSGAAAQKTIYTRTENGYFSSGKALALDAVADGEEVVLTLNFKNTGTLTQCRIYLSGFTGDKIGAEGHEYSVFCALSASLRYTDKAQGEILTSSARLCTAEEGALPPKTLVLFAGDYGSLAQDENGYVTAEIVIKADYSALLEQAGADKTALAGKKFKIGTIGIDCEAQASD